MTNDFHDLLTELVAGQARFLVVGAYALSAHGVPRATVDLDIWVRSDADNAQRVYDALDRFGAPLDALGVTRSDFTQTDMVAQFGLPNSSALIRETEAKLAQRWWTQEARIERAVDSLRDAHAPTRLVHAYEKVVRLLSRSRGS